MAKDRGEAFREKERRANEENGLRQSRTRGGLPYVKAYEETQNVVSTMVEAVKKPRWNITQEMRDNVLQRLYALSQYADDPRITLKASSALISAEKQNQADQHAAQAKHHEHRHSIELKAIQEGIRSDPQYLDYLREQTIDTETVNEDPS